MSYAAAIENLSALIPELVATPGQPRRKFSLQEIGILCAALGEPQKKFPSVLIAGTNGKGSTASTLASIARESGLRVGLYTSPHLERVNERIRINGVAIPDDNFGRLYFQVHDTAEELVNKQGTLPVHPSYFEILTALAFLYFAESQVDLAVLEVGMGGRLDATNIVDPLLSIITDISLDHQEWLGSTIALIAREKAGILRPNGTLITLPQHPEANQAIGEVATELNVRGISATEYIPPIHTDPVHPYPIHVMGQQIFVDSPLKGAHQHRNIALAVAAAVELATHNSFPITPASIERGIHNTSWPGRLETIHLSGRPEFILDVAHNPAGAWALRAALASSAEAAAEQLALRLLTGLHDILEGDFMGFGAPRLPSEIWEESQSPTRTQTLIFSCLHDKPLREMTQILFPVFDHIVLAPIHSPRATDLSDLLAAAEATGVPSTPTNSIEEAIQTALRLNPARIVISGSVYLVGEARHYLMTKIEKPHLENQDQPR